MEIFSISTNNKYEWALCVGRNIWSKCRKTKLNQESEDGVVQQFSHLFHRAVSISTNINIQTNRMTFVTRAFCQMIRKPAEMKENLAKTKVAAADECDELVNVYMLYVLFVDSCTVLKFWIIQTWGKLVSCLYIFRWIDDDKKNTLLLLA